MDSLSSLIIRKHARPWAIALLALACIGLCLTPVYPLAAVLPLAVILVGAAVVGRGNAIGIKAVIGMVLGGAVVGGAGIWAAAVVSSAIGLPIVTLVAMWLAVAVENVMAAGTGRGLWTPLVAAALGTTIGVLPGSLLAAYGKEIYISPFIGNVASHANIVHSDQVLLIGMVGFACAYLFGLVAPAHRSPLHSRAASAPGRIMWLLIVLGMLLAIVGDRSTLHYGLAEAGVRRLVSGGGIEVWIELIFEMSPAILLACSPIEHSAFRTWRWWAWLLVVAGLAAASGSRTPALMVILLVLFVMAYRGERIPLWLRYAGIALIVAIVVVIPNIRAGHAATHGGLYQSIIGVYALSLNGFQGLLLSVSSVPNLYHFTPWADIYQTAALFVPRHFWPGKPVPVDSAITQSLLGWKNSGIFLTFSGHLWAEGGMIAVIFGMAALGYFAAFCQRRLTEKRSARNAVLWAVAMYMGVRLMVSGGIIDLMTTIMMALPVYLIARKRSSQSEEPTGTQPQ